MLLLFCLGGCRCCCCGSAEAAVGVRPTRACRSAALLEEPTLLEVPAGAQTIVVGDLHGQVRRVEGERWRKQQVCSSVVGTRHSRAPCTHRSPQFADLQRIFQRCGMPSEDDRTYIFLGASMPAVE